jgi:hypothetical protein
MLKRHGLVVFLFCLSIILGMAMALIETVTAFFFSTGILFLVGIVTALLAAVTISWLVLKRKTHIRNPEKSVRHQGTAFGIWFAVHNLTWAFIGSLFLWGMIKLFGYKPWVMIFNAAALACTCFALIGIFIIRQRKMLGLCWQSAIPAGLDNFWARAAATMILRERYEYAAEHDQKQPTPLLWSISRVFNRSKSGGADRGIDLLEPRPTFLAEKFKKECMHRFKVLLVLFWATALLAALPWMLGFASHHWDRVPGDWLSDKIKNSKAGKPPMMASKPSARENREKSSSKDENKQTDQEQKKQPDQRNQSNQTDQNRQKTGDTDQNASNHEQERKETQKGNSETSRDQEDKYSQGKEDSPRQDSKPGESRQDSKGKAKEGQEQRDGQGQGQGKGQQGKRQSQGQEQEQGQNQGQGQQGKDQGQGQGQEQGQQEQSQGQEQGQNQGQGQGQQGQGQGQGQEQGQGQSQGQGKAQTGSAGAGIGEGQGLGDPNKPPDMLPEPERLPGIPSRATEMVTLELPTLTDAKSKGAKDPGKETPGDRTPAPKSKAPAARFKPGQQERRSTKPDQYLPNWILNLIKQGKPLKTREK